MAKFRAIPLANLNRLIVRSTVVGVAVFLFGARAEGSCGDHVVILDPKKAASMMDEQPDQDQALPIHSDTPCSGPNCKSNPHSLPTTVLVVPVSVAEHVADFCASLIPLAPDAGAIAPPCAPYWRFDASRPPTPPPRPIYC